MPPTLVSTTFAASQQSGEAIHDGDHAFTSGIVSVVKDHTLIWGLSFASKDHSNTFMANYLRTGTASYQDHQYYLF